MGSMLSDTEILCFDYQVNAANTMARLGIGGRGSQELVAHANSGFVTYEDALDYKMIWTRELYLSNYATQNIKVIQVQIDLSTDMVFVALNNPAMLLKISGATGTILKQKVLFYSGTYSSTSYQLISIGYIPTINFIALYFTDANQVDYAHTVSASDIETSQHSQAQLLALPNLQAKKYLKMVTDPLKAIYWLEYYALVNYNSILRSVRIALQFATDGTIAPAVAYTDTHQYATATNHLYIDSSNQYVRFGCLMNNADLANGGGSFIGFQIETTYFGTYIKYYSLFSGITPPNYVYCREVHVTSTIRPFMLIQHYDATLPAGQQQFLNLVELSSISATGVISVITQTKLQYFQSTFSENTYSNMFTNNGNHFLMYSINAFSFEGRTTKTKHTGFLSRVFLQSTAGNSPSIQNLNCNLSPTTMGSFSLSPSGNVVLVGVSSTGVDSLFTLENDSPTNADLMSQDLSQYQVFTSGCPSSFPGTTIPKAPPSLTQPLFYIIGLDSLVNNGIKSFTFTESATVLGLSTCQKNALTYEIRMKDGTSIPRFLEINRASKSIVINNPLTSATPAEKGEFIFQILLRDIFGDFIAYDVLLIIEDMLTTPVGVQNCYSETNVVPLGYAFDTLYIIGSLKHTKLQIPVPRTSGFANCEKLLYIRTDSIDSGGNIQSLPTFMTLDTANRQIITFLTNAQGTLLKGQIFNVRIRVQIKGNNEPYKTFTFKVYIQDKMLMGCGYYYKMIAPVIDDQIFDSNQLGPLSVDFTQFSLSNSTCNNKVLIKTKALQTSMAALPSCITVDFKASKFYVYPIRCLGGPQTINVRFDAWVDDSSLSIKILQAYTTFSIIIVGTTNCKGLITLGISSKPTYFIERYSNVEAAQTIQEYFTVGLLIQPSTFYNSIPSQVLCDASNRYYKTTLTQDNGYQVPSFITKPWSQYQSYSVLSTQQTSSVIGRYYFEMQSRYFMADLFSYYPSILPSSVFFEYHIYKASTCQFEIGDQPKVIDYKIKRSAAVMTIYFKQFKMLTEGCIYDQLQYEFQTQGGGSLQSFFQQNQGNISLQVSTSKVAYAGVYNIELIGKLNPKLYKAHPIVATLSEFIYPNTDAPRFSGSLRSPQTVTMGKTLTFRLPEIKDVDDDTFTLQIQYQSPAGPTSTLPAFMLFDSTKNEFKISPNDESNVGNHKLSLILTDQHKNPLSRTYPLEIVVQRFDPAKLELIKEQLKSQQKQQYIGPNIEKVTDEAKLIVAFNITVFKEEMGLQQFNNQSLSIKLKTALADSSVDVHWHLTNLTRNKLFIDLNFTNPSAISSSGERDFLIVRFNKGAEILLSNSSKSDEELAKLSQQDNQEVQASVSYLFGQNFILNVPIPKQKVVSSSSIDGGRMSSSITLMKGSVNSLLFGNLILNIILSSSIQMLWGTINTMQLMVIVTLFNISFPENAMFLFQVIAQITRFNLIPMDQFINKFFKFEEQKVINDNYAAMGYNSCNALQNLDTILLFLVGIIVSSVFVLLLSLFIKTHSRKWFLKMHQAVFFNMTIRILLESQIEITLSSTMNFLNLRFKELGDLISSSLSLALGSLMYLTPLLILLFIIFIQKAKLNNHAFESRFGSLYEGLKTGDRFKLLCNFIFTMRRVLLILLAVSMGNYQVFQIQGYIFLSQINLMYLMHFRPYIDDSTNNNEIFNEACVLCLSYQLFVFTDFVDDAEVKDYTGYGLIAAILANFGVNLLLQVIHMIRTLPRAWRKLMNSRLCQQIIKDNQAADIERPKDSVDDYLEQPLESDITDHTTQPHLVEGTSPMNMMETQQPMFKFKELLPSQDIKIATAATPLTKLKSNHPDYHNPEMRSVLLKLQAIETQCENLQIQLKLAKDEKKVIIQEQSLPKPPVYPPPAPPRPPTPIAVAVNDAENEFEEEFDEEQCIRKAEKEVKVNEIVEEPPQTQQLEEPTSNLIPVKTKRSSIVEKVPIKSLTPKSRNTNKTTQKNSNVSIKKNAVIKGGKTKVVDTKKQVNKAKRASTPDFDKYTYGRKEQPSTKQELIDNLPFEDDHIPYHL